MTDQTDNIPLFPVAAWTVGPIPTHDAVTIKFDFLTNLMQPVHQANQGRHYVLTQQQAAQLVQQIQSALQTLQSTAPQAPPGHSH